MLSRKTLGVAGAAILGSMALLVTNPANAVINLTPATGEVAGKVKIAGETLMMGDTNTTTVGGVTYYHVTNDNMLLDIQVDRGIRSDTAVYYRMSLENMVFAVAVTTVETESGDDGTIVSGGMAEDDHIVYSIPGAQAATDNVTVKAPTFGVLPDMPANIKVEVYRDAFDAQASTNVIDSLTNMMSDAVTVGDGISERGTPGTSVADVSEDFMQFAGGDDTSQIGRLRITADTAAYIQDGSGVANLGTMLNDLAPIVVTFKGDFSVGMPSLNTNANCAADNDPTTVYGSTVSDDGEMMKVKLMPDPQPEGNANVDWFLCLMVGEDNDMPLPEGAFTATVEYAANANALGREDQTVTIGSIGRNGTTVHIPYLTTYEGYNQRIVLSNRGTEEAGYTISFRPEASVTATAKAAAMGTLMANSTMTVKATDLVELSGGARTAATIDLVANSRDIDVTSVTVNKETGGTDTVGPSLG